MSSPIQVFPAEYCDPSFWAKHYWMADWVKSAPADYWREMIPLIGTDFIQQRDWVSHLCTDRGRDTFANQLFTRMSQASALFVPWMEEVYPLKDRRILELGCGSGSCTAALAKAGAAVTGVDINGLFIKLNSERLRLLGLTGELHEMPLNWLQTEPTHDVFSQSYDVIACYALLEHLLPAERLTLLRLCKRIMERDGAILAIFETPNRFSPFDWHSSKLYFTDILPEEIAFEYAKQSPRADHPSRRYQVLNDATRDRLARFGRGVSWHEFEIVFGLKNLEILQDGYARTAGRAKSYQANDAFEASLASLFQTLEPPVHRGFCRPSLDLMLAIESRR